MKASKLFLGIGLVCTSVMVLGACGNSSSESKGAAEVEDLPEARFEADKDTPSWQKDTDHEATLKWYVNFDWYAQPGWEKTL